MKRLHLQPLICVFSCWDKAHVPVYDKSADEGDVSTWEFCVSRCVEQVLAQTNC